MIGFNLNISELRGEALTDELIAEAQELPYGRNTDLLRDALRGERIFYTGNLRPWGEMLNLLRAVEENRSLGRILDGSGYPYLFTAQGRDIISEIADAARDFPTEKDPVRELNGKLDPEALYLLEAWDQS